MADQTTRVRFQIQYYLSPFNLPTDEFMQENLIEDGFYPLEGFLKFPRVMDLKATLDDIKNAVEASPVLTFNEDKTGAKFVPQTEEEVTKEMCSLIIARTPRTYKGKVEDESAYGIRQTETRVRIQTALETTYGVHCLALFPVRRNKKLPKLDGTYSGYIQAVLSSPEQVKKCIEGKTLKATLPNKPSSTEELPAESEIEMIFMEHARMAGVAKREHSYVKGVVLMFEGVPEDEESPVLREELRDIFQKEADIAFVAFNKGSVKGEIRFRNEAVEAVAGIVAKHAETPFTVRGTPLKLRILEGEEEAAYYQEIWKRSAARPQRFRHKRR